MTTASQSPDPSSRNVFTSKPLRISVAVVVLLCVALFAFKLIKDNTTLSFSFVLDGKPLPVGTAPTVLVDGQPFASGCTIAPGPHTLTADLKIAEPVKLRVWIMFGDKNLGVVPLESSKGSLLVSVTPSPASVILRRGTETVGKGDAPLTVEKLLLGNYEVEINRGEHKEIHPVKIEGRQRTEAKIDLNLGGMNLSSEPADAEYELSGNGRQWNGKLPTVIDDVPGGDYQFTARRKAWEVNTTISVSRGVKQTNKIEFPYGSLEISSDPVGLMVSTNGVEIGKTPLMLRELKPERYKLTATDGENDLLTEITVGSKEAAKHAFVFRYGTVQLATTPAGASVIRKGKEVGKTPMKLERIPAGETPVVLKLDGYVTTNFTVQVVAGETASLTAKLVSERYLQAMKQARAALDAGQYTESRKFIADALVPEPNDSAAIKLQEDVAQAERKLRYLQAMQQARIALDAGQYTESRKFIADALESEPNDSTAIKMQDDVAQAERKVEEAKESIKRKAEQSLREAEQAYASREFGRASQLAKQALENNATSEEAKTLLKKTELLESVTFLNFDKLYQDCVIVSTTNPDGSLKLIPTFQVRQDVFDQRYRGKQVAHIGKVVRITKPGVIILKIPDGGEVLANPRRENPQAVDTLQKDNEIVITGTISEIRTPSFFLDARLVLENVTIVDRPAK